jgi:FtsP/CotA-like multicopper oxidase with cupredoxin domain
LIVRTELGLGHSAIALADLIAVRLMFPPRGHCNQRSQEPPMAADWIALDRRSFLNAVGRTGAALTVPTLRWGAAIAGQNAALLPVAARAATAETLLQPPEIRSKNGVLEATITAAPGRVRLGDYAFPGSLYNGAYIPPVLRSRVGDTMRITFQNNLPDDPSNLHYHGLVVSPQGRSDNVFVHVHPGHDFKYEVRIPDNGRQGPGLFWYHPHAHGVVAKQMLGGMSGALVIDGSEQLFPILRDLPERFFLMKHAEIGDGNQIISINGQLNPMVPIRPGEMQFWRIANIGATLFIKMRIAGMPLYVVATDGHPLSQPQRLTEFFLGPGQRIDTIAIGPEPGEYAMGTTAFQNEAWRKPDPAQGLATIVAEGSPATGVGIEAEVMRQRVQGERWITEVRSAPIARRRTLEYSKTPDRHTFMIDGRVTDENRVDETVKLGNTEEWTVVNTDQQYHSFHIHQTAFLVTEINGVPQNEDSLRDTFSIPPATDAGPGVLKVVIPFTDPVIVGRFVYHCHAVDHEDKGMMGIVEVVA